MYWQSQTRAWLHASQTELPIGCSRRFHKTGLPKEGDNEEACCDKHALVCEYSLVCDIYILCSVLPPNVELYTFGKTSLNVILNKIRILFYYFYVIVFLCLHSIYQRCLAAVVFYLRTDKSDCSFVFVTTFHTKTKMSQMNLNHAFIDTVTAFLYYVRNVPCK